MMEQDVFNEIYIIHQPKLHRNGSVQFTTTRSVLVLNLIDAHKSYHKNSSFFQPFNPFIIGAITYPSRIEFKNIAENLSFNMRRALNAVLFMLCFNLSEKSLTLVVSAAIE